MFQTNGFDLLYADKSTTKINTFIKELDRLLDGGLSKGIIVELCGSYNCGKTQLCLQLCVNVQLSLSQLTESKAIYVDTKQDFSTQRLLEMIGGLPLGVKKRLCLDPELLLQRIQYVYCSNYTHLLACIFNLENVLCLDDRIKLVIIDSFSYVIRFIDDVGLRTRVTYEMLTHLHELAYKYKILVVITNELTNSFQGDNTYYTVPSLGDTFFHKINQRFHLRRDEIKFDRHWLTVEKSNFSSKLKIPFKICKDGIRDIQVKKPTTN